MTVWIVTGLFGLLGLLFLAAGVGRLVGRKGGSARSIAGAVMLTIAGAAGLIGLNLQTYSRLTKEQDVARVALIQRADGGFDAKVTEFKDGDRDQIAREATYAIAGDGWEIEARVMKFHAWATVAGLDTLYRLDRIEGRWDDIDDQRKTPQTVHALSDNPGIDLWKLAKDRETQAIDANFGSGAYVPMADGATYIVTIAQTGGLIARPENEAAAKAVEAWGR